MKTLTLQSLALENFKGIRTWEGDFNPTETEIGGGNGTGKTTVQDAFCWLLFGKDSRGTSDAKFGIKTNDQQGRFIPDLNHAVTGTFLITDTATGETSEATLKRALVEEWDTDQATGRKTLKGHHTEFWWNGAPLATKTEYDQRVADIIPPNIFKYITDPQAFFALKWEQQRQLLIKMAGEPDDCQVAATNPAFADLLDTLTGKSLDDHMAETAAALKATEQQLRAIPDKIKEANRAADMLIAPDMERLEAERNGIVLRIAQLDSAARDRAEAARQQGDNTARIQALINEQHTRQQQALFTAQEQMRTRQFGLAQQRATMEDKAKELGRQIGAEQHGAKQQADTLNETISRADQTIARATTENEALRLKWQRRNAETFDPECFTCPRFGHRCHDQQAAQMGAGAFDKQQEADLAEITRQGIANKEVIDRATAERQEAATRLETLDRESAATLEKLNDELAAVCQGLKSLPKPEKEEGAINPSDLPEWAEAQRQIDTLTKELAQARAASSNPADTARADAQRQQLNQRLEEIARDMGKREVIAQQRARAAELADEGRDLGARKAQLQHQLATAKDFLNARMDAAEERVNRLFPTVSFRMYSTQIKGEERRPDCVCLLGGVRYQDLNTAGRVTAGIEVVNAICRYADYAAPVFLDNAESVNLMPQTTGQQIRLRVTNDPALTVLAV